MPVATRVVPALGKTAGGERLTITGRAFTPRACPLGACAGVSVFLGAQACVDARLLSDEAITCLAPPGRGLHAITVRVAEAATLTRAGALRAAFYQHSLAFGGLSSGGEGFLALGLGGGDRQELGEGDRQELGGGDAEPGDAEEAYLPEPLRAVHPKPETRDPRPETRDPRPETLHPKPETRNPKPETLDPRPETRDPRP